MRTAFLSAISWMSLSMKTTSVYPSTNTAILFMGGGRLLGRGTIHEIHLEEGEIAHPDEAEVLECLARVLLVSHLHAPSSPLQKAPLFERDLVHHEFVIRREDELHGRMPRPCADQLNEFARSIEVEPLTDI